MVAEAQRARLRERETVSAASTDCGALSPANPGAGADDLSRAWNHIWSAIGGSLQLDANGVRRLGVVIKPLKSAIVDRGSRLVLTSEAERDGARKALLALIDVSGEAGRAAIFAAASTGER